MSKIKPSIPAPVKDDAELSENLLNNIIMIIADTIDLSLSLLGAYDSQLHKSRLAKISQKETCNGIASAFTYSWVIARNNDVRKSRWEANKSSIIKAK